MHTAITIAWEPLLPWPLLAALAALALAAVGVCVWRRARGTVWRALGLAVLLVALANPSLVSERREARPDIALVVVDQSASQSIAGRPALAEVALAGVRESLAQHKDLEVRTVVIGAEAAGAGGRDGGTRMTPSISGELSSIPAKRLAGVIAITDGQVHDAQGLLDRDPPPGPFHVLLTGRHDEYDRRLSVVRAPSFGMVGKEIVLRVLIEDARLRPGQVIPVSLRIDGSRVDDVAVPANTEHDLRMTLSHGGETVIELDAAGADGELTLRNNRVVLSINGVRDRLRVLLVSGEPHSGERTWRNLLKADPSVDLVHFTILRPPEKQDSTPIRELSLIAFPIRELFELKLDEFDLIIFDRYQRRGVLPRGYLANIVEYIRKGGAFLEASGPTFAGRLSLSQSPLGEVLPGRPTGRVIEQPFRPELTALGRRHPVTGSLPGAGSDEPGRAGPPTWGRWFRHIEAVTERGTVLMTGAEAHPLLILERFGEGRVAHLLSDHIWLWSRGFEGGGPQAEVLRRTAHWLMKEPELEEEDLRAVVSGGAIEIVRRALDENFGEVTVTQPDGTPAKVALAGDGPGRASGRFQTTQTGLHTLSDGALTRLVAVGELNPLEFADVRTTDSKLAKLASATGGGVFWMGEDGVPSIRRARPGRAASGHDWAGLVRNDDYVVAGVDSVPLLPGALVLALALGAILAAWRREGR